MSCPDTRRSRRRLPLIRPQFKDFARGMAIATSTVGCVPPMRLPSLKLTDAGARYLRLIDEVFARLESATEQLRLHFGRTIVRLHAPPFFASEMLLPRLSSFSQAHRSLDILIETSVPHPRTHAPEADLSVVVGAGPWDGLVAHPLFAQNFVPACSPTLLAAAPIREL